MYSVCLCARVARGEVAGGLAGQSAPGARGCCHWCVTSSPTQWSVGLNVATASQRRPPIVEYTRGGGVHRWLVERASIKLFEVVGMRSRCDAGAASKSSDGLVKGLLLLMLAASSTQAAVYTVCTGKAYSRYTAAPGTIGYDPMENLRSKLGNLEFFGPSGSAAPDVLQFAAPLTTITTAALEGANCDIWFSGDDTNWGTEERLALGRWLNASDTHFVIAACNGATRGEACRAVAVPAEAPSAPLESKDVSLSVVPGGNPLRSVPCFCVTSLAVALSPLPHCFHIDHA